MRPLSLPATLLSCIHRYILTVPDDYHPINVGVAAFIGRKTSAQAQVLEFGTASLWAAGLGRAATARGAAALWPDITSR